MREGSRTSLPSPPLLFIAFFTLHRSPLSERLEQAIAEEILMDRFLSIKRKPAQTRSRKIHRLVKTVPSR